MEKKELKEGFVDERIGIEYIRHRDYYIPNLVLPKPRRTGNVGKYGRLRERYLKENQKVKYMLMRVNNELISHLLDIDDICRERVKKLVKEMAKTENVDEKLKAENQLEWVSKMNNIKNRAEEIILNEVIYQ